MPSSTACSSTRRHRRRPPRPRASSSRTRRRRGAGSAPTARRATTSSPARPASRPATPSRPAASRPTPGPPPPPTPAPCRSPARPTASPPSGTPPPASPSTSTSADGQAHDLELYFVDWDNKGRGEQVQISDAGTGTVLDTETISSFTSGVYLDWKVSGNLVITITRQAGANAVLNGLFLDPTSSPPPTATASFLKQDATTQGSWIGTYGAQGYDIVSGPTSLPAGDTVTPSGQSTYTWTTTSTDPRALQVPGSSNRVAAVWYSATSFTVDVNLGRRPDARPGAVLRRLGQQGPRRAGADQRRRHGRRCWTPRRSRRSRAGVYLDWKVSGNMRDHDHPDGRGQCRPQRLVPRPHASAARRDRRPAIERPRRRPMLRASTGGVPAASADFPARWEAGLAAGREALSVEVAGPCADGGDRSLRSGPRTASRSPSARKAPGRTASSCETAARRFARAERHDPALTTRQRTVAGKQRVEYSTGNGNSGPVLRVAHAPRAIRSALSVHLQDLTGRRDPDLPGLAAGGVLAANFVAGELRHGTRGWSIDGLTARGRVRAWQRVRRRPDDREPPRCHSPGQLRRVTIRRRSGSLVPGSTGSHRMLPNSLANPGGGQTRGDRRPRASADRDQERLPARLPRHVQHAA